MYIVADELSNCQYKSPAAYFFVCNNKEQDVVQSEDLVYNGKELKGVLTY